MDAQFFISVGCWIKKGDQFLLQKRSSDDERGAGKWLIVGGKLEKGETVINGLEREVMEEIGVKINTITLHLIKDYIFQRDGGNKLVLVFLADWLSGEAEALEENTEVKWFNADELKNVDYAFDSSYQEIPLLIY